MPILTLEDAVELSLEIKEELDKLPPVPEHAVALDSDDTDEIPLLVPIEDDKVLELLLGGMYAKIDLEKMGLKKVKKGVDPTLIAGVDFFYLNNPNPLRHQYTHYAMKTIVDYLIVGTFYILETIRTKFDVTGTEEKKIKTVKSNSGREPFPLCELTAEEYNTLKSLLMPSETQSVRDGFHLASQILKDKKSYELRLDVLDTK